MLTERQLKKWQIIGKQRHKQGISSEQKKAMLNATCYLIDPHMDFNNERLGDKKIADLSTTRAIELLEIPEKPSNYNFEVVDWFVDLPTLPRNYNAYTHPIKASYEVTNKLCSYLTHKCITKGSVKVIKFLYTAVYPDHFAAIDSINEIALNTELTVIDNFKPEYLYYLGMILIGDISPFINVFYNLPLRARCFELTKSIFPQVEARLAYIDLLEAEFLSDIDLYTKMNVLKKWAGRGDLFSRMALAKIRLYEYFESADTIELPLDVINLLKPALIAGHPVAVQLLNDITSELPHSSFDLYETGFETYRFEVKPNILVDLK